MPVQLVFSIKRISYTCLLIFNLFCTTYSFEHASTSMENATINQTEKQHNIIETPLQSHYSTTILLIGVLAVTTLFLIIVILKYCKVKMQLITLKTSKGQHDSNKTITIQNENSDDNSDNMFLSNMAHDLRNPMNAILGFIDVLKTIETDSKKLHYVNTIQQSAHNLLTLINDMVELSKLETGKLQVHYNPVTVEEVANSITSTIKAKAIEKNLEYSTQIENPENYALLLDHSHIQRIFSILVNNALKFTQKGSITLSIKVITPPDKKNDTVSLSISVKDTGVGIPQEKQKDLFNAFQRISSSDFDKRESKGLGLSIAKILAEIMHGNITCQSESNKGAQFTVIFKSVKIAHIKTTTPKIIPMESVELVEFHPATIMIVDEANHNRELLEHYLSHFAFSLIEEENIDMALERVISEKPQLILTPIPSSVPIEHQLPYLIKSKEPSTTIPCVGISASTQTDINPEILVLYDSFLQKPISQADLVKELTKYLPYTIKMSEVPVGTPEEDSSLQTFPPETTLKELEHLAFLGDIVSLKIKLEELSKESKYKEFNQIVMKMTKEFQVDEIIEYIKSILPDKESKTD